MFLMGVDATYIIYMPSLIIPLVLITVTFTLIIMVAESALSKKCFAVANKKTIEKYGPIIMKYVEDLRKECMECGMELEANARYCNKCGRKVK